LNVGFCADQEAFHQLIVIANLAAADDAAIYRLTDDLCLVQTVDVFTPCSDPELVALTQRAWQAYLAREWSDALCALEGVRAICAHDALAAMLQERVVLCAAQPPGPDWDGSVSLDKL
jgi:hypothetical protein